MKTDGTGACLACWQYNHECCEGNDCACCGDGLNAILGGKFYCTCDESLTHCEVHGVGAWYRDNYDRDHSFDFGD